MTGNGAVARDPILKALAADLVPEPLNVWAAALRALKWLTRQGRDVLVRGVSRRLRVAETLSLGEKRFVSILHVDGEQFLVGGSPSSITLLAKLEANSEMLGERSFDSVLSRVGSGVADREIGNKCSAGVTQ